MWKFLLPLLFWVGSLAAEYPVAAETNNLVVHTATGSFDVSRKSLKALDQRIDALQMSTGVYLDSKAELYVAPDRASYQAFAAGKGSLVEFSDAFYSSADQRIYIRSSNEIWSNYGGIIIHEYTHWYLDQILTHAPLWFHEGLATMNGGQLGLDRYYYYIRERFWGNKMDLFRLAYEYPQAKQDWEMYYLTSFFAVKYMQDKDPQAWRDLWNSVANNYRQGRKTRFTAAFGTAYNSNLYSFSLEFTQASRRQAYIYLLTGLGSLVLTALPLLVIYAMIRQRRRMQALPDIDLPVEETPPETETVEKEKPTGEDSLD